MPPILASRPLVHDRFWPLNTTLYVTEFHGNDVRFCYYFLKTLDLTVFNSGSVQPMLNRNYIRNFPIAVPPPREQRAISSILGALDGKIEVNNEIIRTSLSLGDAYYAERTSRTACNNYSLGHLADNGQIEFGDGYRTMISEHGQPGIPILRAREVLDGRIKPMLEDFISDRYRPAIGAKVSRAGDVIMTTKGTVGRVAMLTPADREFAYSPQLCFFRISSDADFSKDYFYFWLRSREFWQQAKSMKSQTDMADYINLRDIRMLTIAVPDGESSGLRMEPFGALLTGISARHQETLALAKLRDTLLPKLISGQLRVKDVEKVVEDAV